MAAQDPVQFKGSGALKRLSASGGAAYGTPRNWSTCFHEVPIWMARDLPSSWPWGVMVTVGTVAPELSREVSVGTGSGGGRREQWVLYL